MLICDVHLSYETAISSPPQPTGHKVSQDEEPAHGPTGTWTKDLSIELDTGILFFTWPNKP